MCDMWRFVTAFAVFAVYVLAENDVEYIPSIYGMQSLSLKCDTEAKHSLILSYEGKVGFDFLRIPRSLDELVHVLVTADNLASFKETLRANNVKYEVDIEDVARVIRQQMTRQRITSRMFREQGLDFNSYPRYDEIKAYIQRLGQTHSHILESFSIGESYEGRYVLGVKFTTGGYGKPALLIDAGIHAREWIAPTTALYAIYQLAENASNHHIFQDIDIYIIPLLNPDGYEYTHFGEKTRLWRKTRSENPDSTCKGVDANRNFELQWMTIGASSIPCSSTYAGNRPFSEPETRALRDFILARRDFIKTYLSFHSFGNYILHPWGFTNELPANEPILTCAAVKAETELSKVRGTHYKIGSSTNVLYPAAGGSDDWAMGIANIGLAYTIELPGKSYGFLAPESEIIPVGEETFEAIKVFANYVKGTICRWPWN